jgi:hypothetical protein
MSTKKHEQHHTHHARHAEKSVAPTEKTAQVVPEVSVADHAGTIRIRAYDLWERGGRPYDYAAQEGFWFDAEKELTAARTSS